MTDQSPKSGSSSLTSSIVSGTTEELFRIWLSKCTKPRRDTTSRAALRQEARGFFHSLAAATEVEIGGRCYTTKSSVDESLALLIQQLGPAFSSTHAARVYGLSALTGALEGCATLSYNLVKLLGAFLLRHCSPLVPEVGNIEDHDEEVRDTAVLALTALLRCKLLRADGVTCNDVLHVRISLAKGGVQNRCALPEEEEDRMEIDHGFGERPDATTTLQSGLSMLARSRRSLCFDLLRAAVDAIQRQREEYDTKTLHDSCRVLDSECLSFITFTCSCLLGESDPRCLLQLLRLFHALLKAFCPFVSFPTMDLFDAIVPYYPIQFTPPPNDKHGVTKAGLQQALLRVMCFVGYDDMLDYDKQVLPLSLGLVLERLLPLPGDDLTNMMEKLEALNDLTALLSAKDASRVDRLREKEVRHLSDALITVHEESSLEVIRGGAEAKQAKEVAELVRNLVSQTALACERASDKALWNAFVNDPLQPMSTRVASSPSQNRVSTAYMACVSSCGGPRTLRRGLELGLQPLLEKISGDSQLTDDELAACIYGIGAFFSACDTSLSRAKVDGINVYPHPLEPYGAQVVEKLCPLLNDDSNSTFMVRLAVVRSLESVLTYSPASTFDEAHISAASSAIESILGPLLGQFESNGNGSDPVRLEWMEACGQAIGRFLGYVLDEERGKEKDEHVTILDLDALRPLFMDSVFSNLIASAETDSEDESLVRQDWKALATACSTGLSASSRIVGVLAKDLNTTFAEDGTEAKSVARAMNYIFKYSDGFASRAYHRMAPPSVSSTDIIKTLAFVKEDSGKKQGILASLGTSMLRLPPAKSEPIENDPRVRLALDVSSLIRPAYLCVLSYSQLQSLVRVVSDALPPLSRSDSVTLAVTLPLLSAAMASSSSKFSDTDTEPVDKIELPLSDLAEYALSSDVLASSRSHALLCLFTVMASFLSPSDDDSCPIMKRLSPLLTTSLKGMIKRVEDARDRGRDVTSHADDLLAWFSLLAVVGSAAAARGGPSSKAADAIVAFFIDLTCVKKAGLFLDKECDLYLDISCFGNEKEQDELLIAAASSLGEVLSASFESLLAKQRLTHLSIKQVNAHLESLPEQSAPPVGVLASSCHLICSVRPQTLEPASLKGIAGVIASGMSTEALGSSNEASTRESSTMSLKRMVLAAVLKLLVAAPSTLADNASSVTAGIMRVFATGQSAEPGSDIAVKLLALQALESLVMANHGRDSLQTMKPAIISILAAAMNHPSALIRQAAVEVRNTWYVAGDT